MKNMKILRPEWHMLLVVLALVLYLLTCFLSTAPIYLHLFYLNG